MRVEGTRTFAAPRRTVWEVLNDPAQMAGLMPGVEGFEVADDRNWTAQVKIPLGLGGLKMSIKMQKIEERELEFAKLHAKGTGVGALLDMDTAFTLGETEGGTEMRWEADFKIAGPVGSMGQRVLQPIVNQQVKNVLDALDAQVQAAKGEGAGAPRTDPTLKDEGPPADVTPEAEPPTGESGAEEGISPISDEPYEGDPPPQTS